MSLFKAKPIEPADLWFVDEPEDEQPTTVFKVKDVERERRELLAWLEEERKRASEVGSVDRRNVFQEVFEKVKEAGKP